MARTSDTEKITDAITLLKQDHRTVEALFKSYERASDKRTKTRIAHEICAELDVHAKIEEAVFYPAAKDRVKKAEDEVNEGIVEHMAIKRLVKDLQSLTASDELFEAKMAVLIEYVKHHVREEETEMFPKIAQGRIDLEELGARMAQAKARLQGRAAPARSRRVAEPA